MGETDAKSDLHRYLRAGRNALLWKLDGLSEYDVRRPLTPTGTNLLGLVKHMTAVELGYFGATFGRPFPESVPWTNPAGESNDDMWAKADESREYLLDMYAKVRSHADATIDALDLNSPGLVEWWPAERREVTLHLILSHVVAETHRHAGHADIVRELVDGAVGMQEGNDNMAPGDRSWWDAYRKRVESAARQADGG